MTRMMFSRILHSKKGIAMESAILFLLITFSFCLLISLLVISGGYQLKLQEVHTDLYVAREQIGEDFTAYLREVEAGTGPESFAAFLTENGITYENYTCAETKTQDSDITRFTLRVTHGTGENTVLYITAERSAQGQITVLSWLPETEITDP